MKTTLRTLLIAAGVSFVHTLSFAQWVHADAPDLTRGNCIAVLGQRILVGTWGGGVAVSEDNGKTWQTSSGGLANLYVTSFLVGESLIYAGTGDGVYVSADSGGTWRGASAGMRTTHVGVHALTQCGGSLIAGTVGYWSYVEGILTLTKGGLYVSRDSGASWSEARTGSVFHYLASVGDFAVAWSQDEGLLRSSDEGQTWTVLPFQEPVRGLAVMGSDLYAGTDYGRPWRSTDQGLTWKGLDTVRPNTSIMSFLFVDSTIFAGTSPSGLYTSSDSGVHWMPVGGGLTASDIYDLAATDSFLFAVTWDQGVFRSDNKGKTWTTSIQQPDQASGRPNGFALGQNYPNPFNPSTLISYSLPHRLHTMLAVYNTLGQKVAELVNGDIDAGDHEIRFNAGNLSSGVYFYRLKAGSFVNTKRLCIVR